MKDTFNTYVNVNATNFSTLPTLNSGFMYTSVASCKLQVATSLTYAEAKKQMVKLAVKHNLKITRTVNYLDPTIITYEACGFLD